MSRRREEDGMGFSGFLPAKESSEERIARQVYEMRAWATSRIEHCRGIESEFGAGHVSIEASRERRALQAVLAFFTVKP